MVEITCPWCQQTVKVELHEIQTAPTFRCPSCGTTVDLEPARQAAREADRRRRAA